MRSARRRRSGAFSALSSSRVATVSLISVPSSARCMPSTCVESEKSVCGEPVPCDRASLRSWKSVPKRRCSAGETLKLSADSRLPVIRSRAARCSAKGTGWSGSRPVPGASRTVRTPPIWRDQHWPPGRHRAPRSSPSGAARCSPGPVAARASPVASAGPGRWRCASWRRRRRRCRGRTAATPGRGRASCPRRCRRPAAARRCARRCVSSAAASSWRWSRAAIGR